MFPLSLFVVRSLCVLGPFLDLLPACPRSASDPEDGSRDDSPITLGNSYSSQGRISGEVTGALPGFNVRRR